MARGLSRVISFRFVSSCFSSPFFVFSLVILDIEDLLGQPGRDIWKQYFTHTR